MSGFKRYLRPAVVASVIGHLAVLIVVLFSVSPNALHAPSPEAMVVEVVTPDDLPRFEGTLSDQHSPGSETPSPNGGKGPLTQAPPPQPRQRTEQQTQQRPVPPRQAQEATAPRLPAPEATQAELVRAEKIDDKQNKSSEPQAAVSPPPSPQQPSIADEVAQYLALGGPLGSGFAAPPVDSNEPGYDWLMQFRERIAMCSTLVGVEPGDKVSIRVRISFNRDGTLTSPPHLLEPAITDKQKALMQSAVNALESCQPFTMLPPDKYKLWKTMHVYITPLFAYR